MGGGGTSLNRGTFVGTGGDDGAADFAGRIDFRNAGLVTAAHGRVGIAFSSGSAGRFVAPDANLAPVQFELGNVTLARPADAAPTDPGPELSACRVLLDGAGTFAGRFAVTEATTVIGTVLITEEIVSLGSTITVAANAVLDLRPTFLTALAVADVHLTGDLAGTVQFTADHFTWDGGMLRSAGTFVAQNTLDLSGDRTKTLLGGALVSRGEWTWTGAGDLVVRGGATLANDPGAELWIRTDADIRYGCGQAATFANRGGLITKAAGDGDTVFDLNFLNYGIVRELTGHILVHHSPERALCPGLEAPPPLPPERPIPPLPRPTVAVVSTPSVVDLAPRLLPGALSPAALALPRAGGGTEPVILLLSARSEITLLAGTADAESPPAAGLNSLASGVPLSLLDQVLFAPDAAGAGDLVRAGVPGFGRDPEAKHRVAYQEGKSPLTALPAFQLALDQAQGWQLFTPAEPGSLLTPVVPGFQAPDPVTAGAPFAAPVQPAPTEED